MALVSTLGCATERPPEPTIVIPVPAPGAAPAQNGTGVPEDEGASVEAAFAGQVQEIADRAWSLATAPCDRLAEAVAEQPTLAQDLRAFAAILKQIAARDERLQGARAVELIDRMEEALGEMDRTLVSCGLRASAWEPAPAGALAP